MDKLKDCSEVLLKNLVFGDFIRMESSTLCQLKCPVCIQNNGETNILGKGYLKFKDFKKFVEKNPYFKNIELSNYGEMFFNPELKEIIEYAYQKKINLKADNGVNLNTVSIGTLEYLVKYEFKLLRVSLDGASSSTYQIYRIGGDFNRVIENIKTINSYKKKYNSGFPELIWQFVIFGHNEHELSQAQVLAQSLGMQFIPKFNWSPAYSPIRNKEFVKRIMGFTSWIEHDEKSDRLYMDGCTQFWTGPQINWDGKLLGCCVNHWADFGNVFETGFKNCLQSERYTYAKKMLLGLAGPRQDLPCYYCSHYKEICSKNQHKKLSSLLENYLANYIK
jgi:MoaA/NifB/PqqE/SkfB family radical SAM enzyme